MKLYWKKIYDILKQNIKLPFKAYNGDSPFIFVSYAHNDKIQVFPILDYLNKSGMKLWYDEGIHVSDNWRESIVENIEKCTSFLVFITPNIINSKYLRKEIIFALKRNKPLFAVFLSKTELPSSLEFEMDEIQSMRKYLMPENEFLNKLREILKESFKSLQK